MAMIAAKMATLKHGEIGNGRKVESSFDNSTFRDEAAKLMNVSTASVDRAKHVLSNGSKPLIEAVELRTTQLNPCVWNATISNITNGCIRKPITDGFLAHTKQRSNKRHHLLTANKP